MKAGGWGGGTDSCSDRSACPCPPLSLLVPPCPPPSSHVSQPFIEWWEEKGELSHGEGSGGGPTLRHGSPTSLVWSPGTAAQGGGGCVSPPCPPEPLSVSCVSPPQRQAEDVVTVASKFKQRYECRLPPAAVRRQPDPEEEAQLYNGSGVAELLRPMAAAPCLVKVWGGDGRTHTRAGWGGGVRPPPQSHPFPPVFSRLRTGGRTSSATGSTSSSTTWKVTARPGTVAEGGWMSPMFVPPPFSSNVARATLPSRRRVGDQRRHPLPRLLPVGVRLGRRDGQGLSSPPSPPVTPPSPRPTLLRDGGESPSPRYPPPGLQAAPPEALPQPKLRQRLPLRPHRPSQGSRSPGKTTEGGDARCPPAAVTAVASDGSHRSSCARKAPAITSPAWTSPSPAPTS